MESVIAFLDGAGETEQDGGVWGHLVGRGQAVALAPPSTGTTSTRSGTER